MASANITVAVDYTATTLHPTDTASENKLNKVTVNGVEFTKRSLRNGRGLKKLFKAAIDDATT